MHEIKKIKITSVSFAFTHTFTVEKLTLLLFFPKHLADVQIRMGDGMVEFQYKASDGQPGAGTAGAGANFALLL